MQVPGCLDINEYRVHDLSSNELQDKATSLFSKTKQLAYEMSTEIIMVTANIAVLKGNDELKIEINKLVNELNMQNDNIIIATRTSDHVYNNLFSLNTSINDCATFLADLKFSKINFMNKSKFKKRLYIVLNGIRSKLTHLLTSVSLHLISNTSPEQQSHEVGKVNLQKSAYSFYYGIFSHSKNHCIAYKMFVESADKSNDVDSMLFLSDMYKYGQGVHKDQDESLKWLAKAADEGSLEGKTRLGFLYLKYFSIFENTFCNSKDYAKNMQMLEGLIRGHDLSEIDEYGRYKEGFDMIKDSAELGHFLAKYFMGRLYELVNNIESAIDNYQASHLGGCTFATTALGLIFMSGKGGKRIIQNKEKAFGLFLLAAKGGGDEAAYRHCGNCYEHGVGTPMNLNEAIYYYQVGADMGSAECQYDLGYLMLRNAVNRFSELTSSATCNTNTNRTTNDPYGFLNLNLTDAFRKYYSSVNVSEGTVVTKIFDEVKSALKYLRMASENGSQDASFQLGVAYECGFLLPPDLQSAFIQYEHAALQGHAKAAICAGNILCQDRGPISFRRNEADGVTDDNYIHALEFYHIAAKQGSGEAMNNIAILLENGHGLRNKKPDAMAAAAWYLDAYKSGFVESALNLGLLMSEGYIEGFVTREGKETYTILKAQKFLETEFSAKSSSGVFDERFLKMLQRLRDYIEIQKSGLKKADNTDDNNIGSNIDQQLK